LGIIGDSCVAHRTRVLTTTTVGVVLVVSALLVVMSQANRSSAAKCADFSALDRMEHVVPAARVVASPWLGPHHVYAVFMVPKEYNNSRYSARAAISDGTEATEPSEHSIEENGYRVEAPSGYYVVHAHVRTRIALWRLLTGRFGHLRRACNWRLVIQDTIR
jgi:hypothetical protein